MTVRRICGFELGNIGLVTGGGEVNTNPGTNVSIDSTTKRTGANSLRVNAAGTGVGYIGLTGFTAAGVATGFNAPTLYPRFCVKPDTIPASGSEEIMVVWNGSAYKMSLRITSAGKLQVYASDGTTQLGSDGATTVQAWDMIEVKCGTGSLAGEYEVKINGSMELSGTGNLTDVNASEVYFGKRTNRNGQTIDIYYDDICISDSAYPGPGQVEVMVPTENGNYTNATIGAGSGELWEQVDEIPG